MMGRGGPVRGNGTGRGGLGRFGRTCPWKTRERSASEVPIEAPGPVSRRVFDFLDIKSIFKTLPQNMIFRGNFLPLRHIKNLIGTGEPEAQRGSEGL